MKKLYWIIIVIIILALVAAYSLGYLTF